MSDEIKNPNTEEDQPDLMTLEDEDGNEITFEVIDALDLQGACIIWLLWNTLRPRKRLRTLSWSS